MRCSVRAGGPDNAIRPWAEGPALSTHGAWCDRVQDGLPGQQGPCYPSAPDPGGSQGDSGWMQAQQGGWGAGGLASGLEMPPATGGRGGSAGKF